MPWSVTVGRFGGTAVKIHITFILLLVWIAVSAWARAARRAALDSTVFIRLSSPASCCTSSATYRRAPLRHPDARR